MSADARSVESLLAFWADAGVEASYADAPIDRTALPAALARPKAATAPIVSTVAARTQTPLAPLVAAPEADPGPGQLAEAQRLAAASPDLEALKAAIAAFDGCSLKFEGARQAVFSRGPADAPVMVVGEGPGGEEDASGEPFVGRAGKLLDKMLAAAGLEGRAFITNTVFWRPPGNRTPTLAEQAVCAPFLERAIQLVAPRVLLLVGGASAKSVLKRSEGILSLRGRWCEWRSADGQIELPAMPTLHPAFLLRQPAAKKKAWEDLMMLAERVDRPDRRA
jgi:uracil-DNA glycosylase family 4